MKEEEKAFNTIQKCIFLLIQKKEKELKELKKLYEQIDLLAFQSFERTSKACINCGQRATTGKKLCLKCTELSEDLEIVTIKQ